MIPKLGIAFRANVLNRLQPDQICDHLPVAEYRQFQIFSFGEIGQLLGSRDSIPL